MNAQEFATIASAIKAAYPNASIMPDKQSKDVWYTMIMDLDYKVCLAAIKEHISTCKFAPTISEIREKCAAIVNPQIYDWGDGWEQVKMAIRRYGMYQEDKAVGSLDDITRRCVKRLGFKELCTSENVVADRANFRMIYEQLEKQEREESVLSIDLKQNKQQIRQLINGALGSLEDKNNE